MSISFFLNIAGALIGSVGAFLYALRIMMRQEQANTATWIIIVLQDFAGLYLVYSAGNTRPYIQIGWCISGSLILLASLRSMSNRWLLGWTEIWSIMICFAAIIIWLISKSATISLAFYGLSIIVSLIPQAKDYFKDPSSARKSAWIWWVSTVAISLPVTAIIIDGKISVEYILIYSIIFITNIVMIFLCQRKICKNPLQWCDGFSLCIFSFIFIVEMAGIEPTYPYWDYIKSSYVVNLFF